MKFRFKTIVLGTVACSQCEGEFTTSSNLKKHGRNHTGEKLFTCSKCYEAFTDSTSLKRHERTHTEEKLAACSQCHKAFSHSQHLKTHERMHIAGKPFACFICDKAFALIGKLKAHEKSHTGEKPHSCSLRGRELTQKGNLKNHARTHTGERTFARNQHEKAHKACACSKSGKPLVRNTTLNRRGTPEKHATAHTGEKPPPPQLHKSQDDPEEHPGSLSDTTTDGITDDDFQSAESLSLQSGDDTPEDDNSRTTRRAPRIRMTQVPAAGTPRSQMHHPRKALVATLVKAHRMERPQARQPPTQEATYRAKPGLGHR